MDIEGSGELNTIITSGVAVSECAPLDEFPGTVQGANNAELRLLTVSITGTGADCIAAISNISASPRLTYVTAEASSEENPYGVYNLNSNPTMTNVTATASGGGGNFGVYNTQSSTIIRGRTLNGSTYSLFQECGTAKVADTQINGFVNEGVICAGVYDENYTFYASTCPYARRPVAA